MALQNTSYQQASSKRIIQFQSFLKKKPGLTDSFAFPDSPFFNHCDLNGPGQNPSRIKLGVGEDLGIVKRLQMILNEAKDNPAAVVKEELVFDFKVDVDAGGTIYFVKPYNSVNAGAGIIRSFDETVTILIVKNAGDA